jgi:hypothetical protein
MANVTLVLVDIQSQVVIDLRPQEATSPIPASLPNSYWLKPGVDFPATRVVAMGMIWDGTRDPVNTNFAPPPPISADLANLTAAELVAKTRALVADLTPVLDALDTNLGG